jgi:hypothetical protein
MKRLAIGIVALVASVSGCASARYIQKGPDSGVVAIPEDTNVWPTHYHDAALALIKAHVGQSYEIVQQYEVPVGTSPTSNQPYNTDPKNPNIMNNGGKMEVRLVYQKKAIPPGGMPLPYGSRPPLLPGTGMGAGAQPAGYVPGTLTGSTPGMNGVPGMGMNNGMSMPSSGMGMGGSGMSTVPAGGMGMGMNNPTVPSVAPAGGSMAPGGGYQFNAPPPPPGYGSSPYVPRQ